MMSERQLSEVDERTKAVRIARQNALSGHVEAAHATRRRKRAHPPTQPEERPWIVRLFTGVHVDPRLVAPARALLGILLSGAIALAASYVRQLRPEEIAVDAAVIYAILTALQGWVDFWIKGQASASAPSSR